MSLPNYFWDRVRRTDSCWEWLGNIGPGGYGRYWNNDKGTSEPAHRVAYRELVGPVAAHLHVDHLCHNRACVNPGHLRAVTPGENNANRRGAQANHQSTGVRGVYVCNQTGMYRVQVGHKRRVYWGGRFASLSDAQAKAEQMRLELHGQPSKQIIAALEAL